MMIFHWLGLAAISITGCIALALWLQGRWRIVSDELMGLRNELTQLKKDQAIALKGSYGMGQRMLRLERRFRDHTKEPVNEVKPQEHDQPFSYAQAAQMIEQGADVASIAATCGLSHSEAHLMQKLGISEAAFAND